MCRIFGIIQTNPSCNYLEQFSQVASSLVHGGPDEQGFVCFPHAGLGATRLAVTGLDGGQQPYAGNGKSQGIYAVLNGQIYNHKHLRTRLEAKGHRFSDTCDGSIIPALYEEYGASFTRYLNGMFALAVLDMRATPTLFVATDSMGIKPLYYRLVADGIAFCSEIAPLALLDGTRLEVEPAYVSEIFSHRIVMGGATLYKNVQALEPGHYLSQTLGQPLELDLCESYHDSSLGEEASLRTLLEREIELMTDSETDACFIVSGGIDSCLIAAIAAQQRGKPLSTFHVSTKGSVHHNESAYARAFAHLYKTHHHDVEIDPDDFPALLASFTQHLGQPDSAPQSLSAFVLARAIQQHGFKVAYGGEGADELFGGYARMVAACNASYLDATAYNTALAPFSPALLHGLFRHEHTQKYPLKNIDFLHTDAIFAFECEQRLPAHLLRRADHLFMASAVEMRVPFCQPRVQQFATKNRGATLTAKPLVYQAARGLVPDSIFDRPKHHFVFPIADIFREHEAVRTELVNTINFSGHLHEDIFYMPMIDYLLKRPAHALSDDEIHLLFTLAVYDLTISATTALPLSARNSLGSLKKTPLKQGGYRFDSQM